MRHSKNTNFLIREESVISFNQKELRIAHLLSEDVSTSEIAKKMGLSVRTIESIIDRMKLKAGAKTRGGLISVFLRQGLIE